MSVVQEVAPVEEQVPAAAAAAPAEKKTRKRNFLYNKAGFWSYAFLSIVALIGIAPLWWTFVVGTRDSFAVNEWPPAVLPGDNMWNNIDWVMNFQGGKFWVALLNSLIISAVITLSVVFFCTLAGYAFAKLRFKGRNVLFAFILVTLAIPVQLGIIPLFILINSWGLVGNILAVIMPGLVTAFGVFFMRQYLVDAIPDELIEAARVDGANQWKVFMTAGLPAARPAMAILGLFTFVSTWTDFMWPYMVLGAQNPTVQTVLAFMRADGGHTPDYSRIFMATFIATVPLLLLFIFAGKQLISGIMAGAVKG